MAMLVEFHHTHTQTHRLALRNSCLATYSILHETIVLPGIWHTSFNANNINHIIIQIHTKEVQIWYD